MNHHEDDQIPWTTARCNRLLRPISSRLTALRKNIESAKSQKREGTRAQSKAETPEVQEASTTQPKPWKKGDGANDPEWIPEAKPRKTFKKYSASRAHREVQNPTKELPLGPPGEILVPTPFIARTLRYVEQSPQYASPEQAHNPSRRIRKPMYFQPKDRLQTLKKETSSDVYGYINGVYSGFENVLEATAQYGPKKEQKGTRSLMSTCLRQIPAHIELREYWQEEEDEVEEGDIAVEIYGQLEQRATRDSNARHGLGEVVRAHATKMICEAMVERLLPLSLLPSLVDLCKRTQAWDAGHELFSVCMMTLQSPLIAPLHPLDDIYESLSHSILNLFRDYVEQSRSWSLFYQQLSFLLRANKLPVEWLATRSLLPVWTRIIKSINEHESSLGPARELLQGLFLHSCGIRTGDSYTSEEHDLVTSYRAKAQTTTVRPSVRCALSNTIDSLLTIFSCASRSTVAGENNHALRSANHFARILEDICQSLLLETNHEPQRHISGETPAIQTTFIQRACGLVVSTLIMRSNQHQHPYDISLMASRVKILRRLASSKGAKSVSIFDTISKLAVSVSQSYSRVTGENTFGVLQKVLAFTRSFSEPLDTHYTHFLNEIAYETALKYSAITQNQEHFQYAKSLERDLRTLMNPSPDRSDSSMSDTDEEAGTMDGYRWEEGIEEWIIRTPALPRKTMKGKSTSAQETENSCSRSRETLMESIDSDSESTSQHSFSKRISRSSRTETPPTPAQSSSPIHETSMIAPPRHRDHSSPAVVIYRARVLANAQTTSVLKPTRVFLASFAERLSRSSSPSSDESAVTSQDSCTSYSDSGDLPNDVTSAKLSRKRGFVHETRAYHFKRHKDSAFASSSNQKSGNRRSDVDEDEDESSHFVPKSRMSSRIGKLKRNDGLIRSNSSDSSNRGPLRPRRNLRSHEPSRINRSMAKQPETYGRDCTSDEEDELDELVQFAESSNSASESKRRTLPTCPVAAARRRLRTRRSGILDHGSGDELSFG